MKSGGLLNQGGFAAGGNQSFAKAMHLFNTPNWPRHIGMEGQPITPRRFGIGTDWNSAGRLAHSRILSACRT